MFIGFIYAMYNRFSSIKLLDMKNLTAYISPFRLVAISLYLGVIVTKYVKLSFDACIKPVSLTNDFLFLLILIGLIGIEIFEHVQFPVRPPFWPAVGLLGLRILLFEIIRVGDCSYFFGFLYLLPPLIAYRYFSPKIGYLLAGFYTVYFTYWHAFYEGLYYSESTGRTFALEQAIDETMIYVVGIVFGVAVANTVLQEEKSRIEAERLLKELEESQHQVAELAATEERNRLARNIHDSVGHYLTVVGIQLDKAIAYREIDTLQSDQAIRDAKRAADTALEDVRHSVSSLRDEDNFSLSYSLHELIRTSGELPIDLEMKGEEGRYSRAVLTTLFRAVQEGLTNIHKHAQASKVNIKVGLGLNEAQLEVEDNGLGFDLEELEGKSLDAGAHFGLQGLRERLELVGGKLFINSQVNQGTVLQVTIPRKELSVQ